MDSGIAPRWREQQRAARELAGRLRVGDRVHVVVREDVAPSYDSDLPNLMPVLYPAIVERLPDDADALIVVLDGVVRRGDRVLVDVDDLRA